MKMLKNKENFKTIRHFCFLSFKTQDMSFKRERWD